MMEQLLLKEHLSKKEKLVLFRWILKEEMDVLDEYCDIDSLPKGYRLELCHVHDVKKVNIARLLSVIEYYDPDFIKTLAFTDPRVRTFVGYYFEFLKTNPYGYEALEPSNLFGNWDFIKYKLKVLFPNLSLDEIEKFKFKRKEFIEYVKEKTGESYETIESKLNKATWYETVPYLQLEEEMSKMWHPEPVMTDEDWNFIKRHVKGRKNIFIKENGKEKFVYIDVDLSDEEIDKYRKDRESLKKLLMQRYNIDENGAEQVLRKAGWESETYHIIPPIHTDVVLDYGKEHEKIKEVETQESSENFHMVANFIRYLGGLELQILNYYDLVYDKLEDQVKEILDLIIRTQRKILGKLFGIFYTCDPIMAEAILTINPERYEFLKSLSVKDTVRDKEFKLFSNPIAWKKVKERIVMRFPEITEEELEQLKGHREKLVQILKTKTNNSEETIEKALEECGWTKEEEIPAAFRQIGP